MKVIIVYLLLYGSGVVAGLYFYHLGKRYGRYLKQSKPENS